MSRVFVVQESIWRNPETGRLEPKFDLSAAAKYGDIQVLLPGARPPMSIEHLIEVITEGLSDFSDDDYLLPTGSPVAILWAGIIAAARNNGRVGALQWDRKHKVYIKTKGAVP